jgi:hypothetical protein
MKHCHFLKVIGMVAVAIGLMPLAGVSGEVQGRSQLDLSGPGWRVWQDAKADWQNDALFLPDAVNLKTLPVNPPTGGWEALKADLGTAASVPGTVEEYLFTNPNPGEMNPKILYTPFQGVSWWFRALRVPQMPAGGRLLLQFEAVSMRAEVYVNRKLVGYDLIGHTPFEVDITDAVKPGEECQLAVRVTNPGGNWTWVDFRQISWGENLIPHQHSFGGLTGHVKLVAVAPLYVDDLYVQNTPAMRDVNVQITVRNRMTGPAKRDVLVRVGEKANPEAECFRQTIKDVVFMPGETCTTVKVSVADAKLWDLEHPNLYVCSISLANNQQITDAYSQPFGFRWFSMDGIGSNAVLRLNGKRIVLRTAISWGFWPANGATPTPELAEKQIRLAKDLGLNMLNFHRCIGTPVVMDKADELGLLYFEEPGGYVSGGKLPLGQGMAREKLFRMVKRDRNHPSLVIYNMINEQWIAFGADKDDSIYAIHTNDMRAAHALDPSRTMLYTSAWAEREARAKTHMRPMDNQVYLSGWWDSHRAPGPVVWLQDYYQGPDRHYGLSENTREIVFWGEEGAVSTPPRLEKIKADVEAMKVPGWDGQIYLDWYRRFDEFIQRKKLAPYFPTVDALTCAMGVISLEHQGRKIEDTRICDANDGYAVNGWEAEPFENHSGIVDGFRNPKADASVLAYYNQPLYVAVKVRRQTVQIPGEVVTDFYAINEKNLKGAYTLKVRVLAPDGSELFKHQAPVMLQGGDVYGQLLLEGVNIPIVSATGMIRIQAELSDAVGAVLARGRDEILSVDWKGAKLTGKGAVWESGSRIRDFLKQNKGVEVTALDEVQGSLDWMIVARPLQSLQVVPTEGFSATGISTIFYSDRNFKKPMHRRVDKQIDFEWSAGATPDAAVSRIDGYTVTFEGQLMPPVTGDYLVQLQCEGGKGNLLVGDNKQVAKGRGTKSSAECSVRAEAGKPLPIRVEFSKGQGLGKVKVCWSTPKKTIDTARLFQRVRQDGTTLIVMESAEQWAEAAGKEGIVEYKGVFPVGMNWVGGQYFVRAHPLFKDLPVNQGMNWPYQAVLRGVGRNALKLEGEELVAGAYNSPGCELGTAVGIVPCGKGKIIFSTLPILSNLGGESGSSDVAFKLLCNYIEFAAGSAK